MCLCACVCVWCVCVWGACVRACVRARVCVCSRNRLTKAVQQSPSLNASVCSGIQTVNCISRYLKVYYLGRRTHQLSLSWSNWIRSAASHPISSKIHFNIVLLFTWMSSKWAVPSQVFLPNHCVYFLFRQYVPQVASYFILFWLLL